MTQEEKKFKLLKITDTRGNVNYVPFNNSNVQFYREHKQKLTREKLTRENNYIKRKKHLTMIKVKRKKEEINSK